MNKSFSICIAGGGSTYTPGIVLMLLDRLEQFPLRQIKFYDDDKERQEVIALACDLLIKEKSASYQVLIHDRPQGSFQ